MLGLLASYMLRLLRSGPRAHALGTGPPDPLRGIAAAAAAGDTAAQRTLLIETGSALLRTVRAVLGANSTELEDVLQEAMTAVHLALPSFRGECSTLHFVCRLGVHTAMNARRRGRIRARHIDATDDAELVELARDDVSPAEQLTAARRRATLRQLLAELPELQAEVLALHTMLGYTVEETAQVTGAPVNTVRSRLRAALSALREGVGRREATRSRSGGLVTDERRRASHRVEDLSILARRGALSTVEQRALTRALTSSPTLATAHQLGLDFDRFAAVRPGDDALIAAVASRVTSGKRGTARGRRRLRAVLLVAVLTSAGTAAAWWKRARAPAVTSLPAARLPSASRATRAAPHAADTGAELGAAPPPSSSPPSASSNVRLPSRNGVERPERGLDSAEALFREANVARRAGDYAGARALYLRLEHDFPASDEAHVAHLSLGNLLLSMGRASEAEQQFSSYLLGRPALAQEALVGRAQSLGLLGRSGDERRVWESLLHDYPSSVYVARAQQRLAQLAASSADADSK